MNANAPRSRSHYCLVVCQSRESTQQARYKPPNAVDVPSRCGLNIINKDICVSAMLRSPLYRAALMPPACSPSAFLEVGVVTLSVPVDPPGATHNILGRSTSADAPRSHSFPVICQLADDSRRYKAARCMLPVLPLVVSSWVRSPCHVNLVCFLW